MAQDVLVEVSLAVDLEDHLINAGCGLTSGAFDRHRADDLAVVHNELFIE
jgi:hypothetical protein